MNYSIKRDETSLHIFHEGRKRKIFVGTLTYYKNKDVYEFIYDKKYAYSKNAIPLGPELSLFKLHHESEPGKLFPAFIDRIPDQSNPAYKDYCMAEGISADEDNPIILLGAIGKRGPSSFVFEPIYNVKFHPHDITKLRTELQITQHDLALAFDISKTTLQRIESGKSYDIHTLKQLQIFLIFPEVALWQLKQTSAKIHKNVSKKLINYFEEKLANKFRILK